MGDSLEISGLDPQTFLDDGPEALALDPDTAVRMHRGGVECGLSSGLTSARRPRSVETMGIEPTTPCLQSRCSAN